VWEYEQRKCREINGYTTGLFVWHEKAMDRNGSLVLSHEIVAK